MDYLRKDRSFYCYPPRQSHYDQRQLIQIEDNYFLDSGKSIVCHFLANAATWKGETARRIKKELKKLANIK